MNRVISPPLQGQWTEAEYLAIDNTRLELSNGCLEELPMPTILHQLIVAFLHGRLNDFVTAHGLGFALFAPLPVRLWSGKYREPDIVYLKPERMPDLSSQPQGADLVMEVLSEGEDNRQRDLKTKRDEYARAGIAEYWIVDPEEGQVTVLTLEGASYRVHGLFGAGMQATSVLLAGFAVSVDAMLAVGREGK